MDRHYTPLEYATSILSQMVCGAPAIVADFAAGEGALLLAARKRWPNCRLIAVDVDANSVRKLRRKFSDISVTTKDFLDNKVHVPGHPLNEVRKKVSLVFLNPPFSCRGGLAFTATLNGKRVRCSKALAFVINSLPYITKAGRVLAILPSSCLTSQKDAVALAELRLTHEVEVIAAATKVKFEGCSVSVTTVCVRKRKKRSSGPLVPVTDAAEQPRLSAAMARGNLPMAPRPRELQLGGFRLIHTTSLRQGVVIHDTNTRVDGIAVSGPLILLPRVGQPNIRKVCLYLDAEPIVLSDCVIALSCADRVVLRAAYASILANAEDFMQAYVGSCAKYLTLDRLAFYLMSIGIRSEKMSIAELRTLSIAYSDEAVLSA